MIITIKEPYMQSFASGVIFCRVEIFTGNNRSVVEANSTGLGSTYEIARANAYREMVQVLADRLFNK